MTTRTCVSCGKSYKPVRNGHTCNRCVYLQSVKKDAERLERRADRLLAMAKNKREWLAERLAEREAV